MKYFDVIFQVIQTRKCVIGYSGDIKTVNIKERIDVEKSTLLEQTDPEILTTVLPEGD